MHHLGDTIGFDEAQQLISRYWYGIFIGSHIQNLLLWMMSCSCAVCHSCDCMTKAITKTARSSLFFFPWSSLSSTSSRQQQSFTWLHLCQSKHFFSSSAMVPRKSKKSSNFTFTSCGSPASTFFSVLLCCVLCFFNSFIGSRLNSWTTQNQELSSMHQSMV